jgi:GT2 family glycosyltransferase
MPPPLTVISTSFNHERFIAEHFNSLKEQSFQHFDIIFCDDASQDGSFSRGTEILKTIFPNARSIRNEKNIGFTSTLNNALKHVESDFVQIISCDDKLDPKKLETQIDALSTADPSVAFAYGPIETFGNGCEDWKKSAKERFSHGRSFSSRELYDKLLRLNFISAPSTIIRTSSIRMVGGYDETLMGEDWDMWLRLAQAGLSCFWVENSLSYYRIHTSNTASSQRREVFEEEIIRTLRKHINHPSCSLHLDPLIRNAYRRGRLSSLQRLDFIRLCLRGLINFDVESFAIILNLPNSFLRRFNHLAPPANIHL